MYKSIEQNPAKEQAESQQSLHEKYSVKSKFVAPDSLTHIAKVNRQYGSVNNLVGSTLHNNSYYDVKHTQL